MTFDEAIAHEREVAKEIYVEAMLCHANPDDGKLDSCIEDGRYHERLAEWLEELKKLRQCTNIENGEYPYFNDFKEGKQVGYNKAIDDLLDDANEMAIEVDTGTYTMKAIGIGLLEQIAEQLKAGGTDEMEK